jgi:Flp pilus assembly protein TadD
MEPATGERPTLSIGESMAMAWRHHAAGTFRDAALISTRVLQLEPHNPDALHLLGVLAYQANDQDRAIQLIGAAIRVHRTSAPMHGNLALAKLAKGDFNGAAASARKAVELTASYADAHRVLGLVYQRKGRLREAVREFERAQGLGLQSDDLTRHLSQARAELGITGSSPSHGGAAPRARPATPQKRHDPNIR